MRSIDRAWVNKKINELKIHPSRENGQNFLVSSEPLEKIIAAGDVREGDRVLEIGPGLGALTESLLHAGAHVTAIEFDPKLVQYLEKNIPKKFPHEILHGDALAIARPEFLKVMQPYKLIANIPYHLTSEIVRHFVESAHSPTTICLLIQKEVAERLIAKPPRTNQLALFTQWFASVEYIATVSRQNFIPAPEVDSAIVRLIPGAGAAARHNVTPAEQKNLFSLIKRGFSSPRKQLRNNLSPINTTTNFDFTRRAETLTHEEWINLLRALS
ncbi:MAG: ribosomal RNA small subunit methyltransferase A [Candidatus Magasanikbacteria bacterium RIFCSPHIGHO2_01_FULL_50_8]|uniref:Ribosomal RNA small subunit methyltransferase A n=2 Tax=Candidatus Magasanikiibacteriota TaxID=1752731 RepID=A0A1F6LPQ7_9BACT|nr:MAG: ribosomal RNA small subunit methyltransferase A [Candidatus Magasanikbacteria bacterium RIFCSPHIGHO2_01_FULL_50_8]OGH68176.1 MAG: ribosomal RNA small subunit methyltransferase A [Candidatus Magasanikbacteria bacterium RIFCSPHIGHO2_02_FULL_50_9b]